MSIWKEWLTNVNWFTFSLSLWIGFIHFFDFEFDCNIWIVTTFKIALKSLQWIHHCIRLLLTLNWIKYIYYKLFIFKSNVYHLFFYQSKLLLVSLNFFILFQIYFWSCHKIIIKGYKWVKNFKSTQPKIGNHFERVHNCESNSIVQHSLFGSFFTPFISKSRLNHAFHK